MGLSQFKDKDNGAAQARLPTSLEPALSELAPSLHLIDVRRVPPPERHPLILGTFDALVTGAAFELVNDHDPVPLHRQFDSIRSGQFDWHYLARGPELWHVRITRVQDGEAGGPMGCCGGCSCR